MGFLATYCRSVCMSVCASYLNKIWGGVHKSLPFTSLSLLFLYWSQLLYLNIQIHLLRWYILMQIMKSDCWAFTHRGWHSDLFPRSTSVSIKPDWNVCLSVLEISPRYIKFNFDWGRHFLLWLLVSVLFPASQNSVFVQQGKVRVFGMMLNKIKFLVMLITVNMDFMTDIRGNRN